MTVVMVRPVITIRAWCDLPGVFVSTVCAAIQKNFPVSAKTERFAWAWARSRALFSTMG